VVSAYKLRTADVGTAASLVCVAVLGSSAEIGHGVQHVNKLPLKEQSVCVIMLCNIHTAATKITQPVSVIRSCNAYTASQGAVQCGRARVRNAHTHGQSLLSSDSRP
jgi:hypothetical protein